MRHALQLSFSSLMTMMYLEKFESSSLISRISSVMRRHLVKILHSFLVLMKAIQMSVAAVAKSASLRQKYQVMRRICLNDDG